MNEYTRRVLSVIVLISFFWSISPASFAIEINSQSPEEGRREVVTYKVTPERDHVIQFDKVTLEIPAGAVKEPVELTIEKLDRIESLNQGMKNVTGGATGYRFGPHPFEFEKNIKVTLPYAGPVSRSESEISNLGVWFFNEEQSVWEGLPSHSLDKEQKTITGLTNHFTDMITSTLTLPESPGPINFDPNSIKELKAADPGSIVPRLEGLEPGPFGGASFSIPLRLTPGRGKATPRLALSYNCNSANSWMGRGFDISVPSVTIDTRFGLPDYDGDDDYVLAGEPLVSEQDLGGGITSYSQRLEGPFNQILRYRQNGSDWWEVREKDGTLSVYGSGDAWSGRSAQEVFVWKLKEKRDTNGNFIRYDYATLDGHLYLSGISWSGYGSDTGPYRADFVLGDRIDKRIDNRGKFSSKLSKRLDSIQLSYNGQVYRTYDFTYENNVFGHTQLLSYSESDGSGNELYEYDFDYFALPERADGFEGFGDTIDQWETNTVDAMDISRSASIGFDLYLGISIDFFQFYWLGIRRKPLLSFGVNGGYSHTNNWNESVMADLDGNGLPDMVRQNGSTLSGYLNQGNGFNGTKDVGNFPGILNRGGQDSFSFGTTVSASLASGGMKIQHSNSDSRNGLTDINGDGFLDVVTKGLNSFASSDNSDTFQTVNWAPGMEQGAQRVISQKELDDYKKAYYVEEPVKRWEAYKPGDLTVEHKIHLLNGEVRSDDGVRAVVDYPDSGEINTYNVTTAQPEPSPIVDTVTVGTGDYVYMLLDSGDDVKDRNTDEPNPFTDDLFWSTEIRYDSIGFFSGDSEKQAIYYFKNRYYNTIPEGLTPFYSEIERNEPEDPYIWDLKDDAETLLANMPYGAKINVWKELIGEGSFIPKILTMDQFSDLYSWASPLNKVLLQILYPYNNKRDRFILQKFDKGYYSENLARLTACFNQLNLVSRYSLEDRYALAQPFFEGQAQFWVGDGGSARTGFSKFHNSQSVLYDISSEILSESDLGKSFGLENSVLLDRVTDLSSNDVHELFLEKDGEGDFVIRETGPGNSSANHEVTASGNRISFSRGLVEHEYTLAYHAYPAQVESTLFENAIIPEVMAGETAVLHHISSLESDYYHSLADPVEQVYLIRKGEYEALQGQYDQILIDLPIAEQALQDAIDNGADETEITEKQKAVDDLILARDYLEEPLADALTAYETSESDFLLFDENYEYVLNSDRYEMVWGISDEEYKTLFLLMLSDFSRFSDSAFSSFAGKSPTEFGIAILSEEEKNKLIASASSFANEDFVALAEDELPDGYAGTFYMQALNRDAQSVIEQVNDLDEYRFFVEKFPYYKLDGAFYFIESGLGVVEINAVTDFFQAHGVLLPQSVRSEYYYRENTLFPQNRIVLENDAQVYPVNHYDGESIDLESGTTCSVFDFLTVQGNRTVIQKIKNLIFDSGRDFSTADTQGIFSTYTEEQLRDFYLFDPNPYESESDLPIELSAYREWKESEEHFNGGYRNWSYGFWSGLHQWDPADIGNEVHSLTEVNENTEIPDPGSVESAAPPFLVGAVKNWNSETLEVSVAAEGIDGDSLSKESWIGSVSEYQDSELRLVGGVVETVYNEYDFAPYLTGDNIWHPMRKGGPTYYRTPGSDTGSGGGGQSLNFIQGSYSNSVNLTFGITPVNYSRTEGTSRNFKSLMDINGDRYPDLITNDNDGVISYIAGTGVGFSGSQSLSGAWSHISVNENTTNSFGVSFGGGGSEDVVIGSNGRVTVSIAKPNADGSIGAGLNGSLTGSMQTVGLQDINGDGLPDHLKRTGSDSISAMINVGDSFQSMNWGNGINNGLNSSKAGNLGGTLSFGIGFVGASAGLSGTVNKTEFQLMDINGDGLADQVEKLDNTDYFSVRFNLGDTFTSSTTKVYCPDWDYDDSDFRKGIDTDMKTIASSRIGGLETNSGIAGAVSIDDILDGRPDDYDLDPFSINDNIHASSGVSLSLSGNVSIKLTFLLLTFTIQPGINGSIASTGTSVKMMDMTGNGAPDHLLKAPGDDILRLRVNQMDKVGMLTGINLPQGGKYSLVYDRTDNTVWDPNSRWILESVTKSDGYEDDAEALGDHSYTTTFSYSSGKYDRTEREFLGFKEVTTQFADGSRQVNEFLNGLYDTKGKISRTRFFDENDNLLRDSEYVYGSIYPTGSESVFFRLTRETSRRYESSGSYFMETTKEYSYDEFGNIDELESSISGAGDNQDYLLRIEYSRLPDHIVGLPSKLETWTGHSAVNSRLLRMREADYDNRGNLISLEQYSSINDSLATTLEYDDYGNIIKVTDPSGYSIAYAYDSELNQYIERISSFNESGGTVYNSHMEWDKMMGLETASVEINGNRQEKSHDSHGRLIEIRTPYDTGQVPAVSYEFFTESFPWRAVSSNKVSFDPHNHETIETVVAIDGLGRVSQTAKEGDVTLPNGSKVRGWNKSGLVVYDAKARSVMEGQRVFEEKDYSFPLLQDDFPAPSELIRETVKHYDALDRIISTTLADGSVMSSSYQLGQVDLSGNGQQYNNGEVLQLSIQTDPLGNYTEIWKNGRGMIAAMIKKDHSNRVLTEATYMYNILGELLETSDYNGNKVNFEYDLLGRQLSVESPDAGRQEFLYNETGLLWRKNDSKLRQQGFWIEYEYDEHNRMSRIEYPEMDDVVYTYGSDPGLNNVGRLASVTNESGSTSYEYGKMGEVTRMERVINRLTPNSDSETAAMSYESDYLGRMERITYPDGEVLTYGYDRGGQIVSAVGDKNGKTFPYINDIGYDEFGQRVYIRYGNGTETRYSYDEDRRWLDSIETGLENSVVTYQNMTYEFDAVGNILSTINDTFNHTTRQEYSYDSMYQLTEAEGVYNYHRTGGSVSFSSLYTQDFSYDKIGNMLSKSSSETTSPSSGVSHLDYNSSYRYYSDAPHRVEQIGDMYYRYDHNGNTIEERMGGHRETDTKEQAEYIFKDDVTIADAAFAWSRSDEDPEDDVYSRQLFWDEENRLKGTSDPFHWTQYAYDHEGERTLKYSDMGETLYFNSMWSIADTWASQGLRQSKNIYIGETRIATKLNFKDSTDYGYEDLNTYYYHSDHLGSSSVITDPDGAVYEHLEYTPYGEIWVEDQKDEDLDKIPFRFTAKEWDEETRLYYMSARYQNPMTSRWMSADPLGPGLVNPMRDGFHLIESLNWFSYTGNNPVRFKDPSGFIILDVSRDVVQQDSTKTLGTGTGSISDYGCVLTTFTRMANTLSGKSFTVDDANRMANKLNLYEKGNLLSPQAGAELVNALVNDPSKVVTFDGSTEGSGAEIGSKLNALENSDKEYLTSGRIHTTSADGKSKYDHQVNINSGSVTAGDISDMDNPFNFNLSDTSNVNRQSTADTSRSNDLFRVDAFQVVDTTQIIE